METDKDHIHYMIETEPTMSISKIVNVIQHTIYGKDIFNIYENNSGKNIPLLERNTKIQKSSENTKRN